MNYKHFLKIFNQKLNKSMDPFNKIMKLIINNKIQKLINNNWCNNNKIKMKINN